MTPWLALAVACGGTTPTPAHTGGRTDTSHTGTQLGPATLPHRGSAATCAERPLPDEPVCLGYADECQVHADCTAGDAGTCLRGGPYGQLCICAYDACHEDGDCGEGAVCGCASDAVYGSPTNACYLGDCRVDADCTSGVCQADRRFWCGTADADDVLPVTGWRCTTPGDSCNGDEDCDTSAGDRCMWIGEGRFACSRDYVATCD